MKTADSVWPMILLALLVCIFFSGGTWLEFEAADHGFRKILENQSLPKDQLEKALALQTERISRIHQAAIAALDLSKIGLGAVVALATQHITANSRGN